MTVSTDDAVVRVKDTWSGTPDFRLPEARYGAWAAAFVGVPAATVAAWTITRAFAAGGVAGAALTITVAAAAAWRASTWAGKHFGTWQTKYAPYGLAAIAVGVAFPATTSGGPIGGLLAVLAALTVGLGGTVALIRKAGKRVNAVTPVTYMTAVFMSEVQAPREQRVTTREAEAPTNLAAAEETRTVEPPTIL